MKTLGTTFQDEGQMPQLKGVQEQIENSEMDCNQPDSEAFDDDDGSESEEGSEQEAQVKEQPKQKSGKKSKA